MLIMAFSFLRMFLTMTANSRGWWQRACKSKHTSWGGWTNVEDQMKTRLTREHPLRRCCGCSSGRTIFLPICISFILSTTLEFCWAIVCSVLMAWSNRIRAWDSCSTFSNMKSSLWATHTNTCYSNCSYVCLCASHTIFGSRSILPGSVGLRWGR